MYVDPDKQGQGIGTALMKRVLLDLNRPVQLDVFTHNLKAKRLYQKFGFQVIDSVLFKKAQELFDQQIYAYYFDIPFEEIMKRHQERHEASFGEKSALVVE